jgi:putative CocE/NonD family hydrolase
MRTAGSVALVDPFSAESPGACYMRRLVQRQAGKQRHRRHFGLRQPQSSWARLWIVTRLVLFAALMGTWNAREALAGPEPDPPLQPKFQVRLERNVRITMRDGIRLAADLYFPSGAPLPLPAVLIRTPYNKRAWRDEPTSARRLAEQGFVAIVEDWRGMFQSEGTFTIEKGIHPQDGYDTVSWIAAQPWSNKKIATFGCSAHGHVQITMAPLRHPNVRAMIIGGSGGVGIRDVWRQRDDGVLELRGSAEPFYRWGSKVTFKAPRELSDQEYARLADFYDPSPHHDGTLPPAALWTLPVVDILRRQGGPPTDWEAIVTHPIEDSWWDGVEGFPADASVDTPVLWVNSWYDSASDTIEVYQYFKKHGLTQISKDNQYLVISPAEHCRTEELTSESKAGSRDLGDARIHLFAIYIEWLRNWLTSERSDVIARMPHVQYYLMGENQWHSAADWPPPGTTLRRYYLSSRHRANSMHGDGMLDTSHPTISHTDTIVYDPTMPVPSGDTVAYDQRDREVREDVLVYTSPVLSRGVAVVGRVQLRLYVSSSAPDTDFFARLVDVYPDGRALNVSKGGTQLRYREGLDHQVKTRPGEVYELLVDLKDTANLFLPGHRIRIDISSSDFPDYVRNLNTGGDSVTEVAPRVARNSVHIRAPGAPFLALPILDTSIAPAER